MQYIVDTEIQSSYYPPERTRHRFDTLEEAEAYTALWLALNVKCYASNMMSIFSSGCLSLGCSL